MIETDQNDNKNIITIVIIWILIIFIRSSYFDNTNLKNIDMEPFSEPIQEKIIDGKTFEHKTKEGIAQITPIANYKIHGRVLDIHYRPSKLYWASVYPYDITIGFGNFKHKKVCSNIKFKMVDTVVYWSFSYSAWNKHLSKYFKSENELNHCITNNHICPANKRILDGLKKLSKKDIVYIEGYLIKFKQVAKDGKLEEGISSTSRNDKEHLYYGDNNYGSCEQIYVTRLVSKHGDFQ